jgi:GDP-4-dehydro-6-deoxy-D-mannose reductase
LSVKVLVTGADGFVGNHLVRALRDRGDSVDPCGGPGGLLGLELTDGAAVSARVEQSRPDAVIHLAGVSSVARSHEDPGGTVAVNVLGSVHLLEAVRRHAPNARILLVGTGEAYGRLEPGERAEETHPLRPLSPYAASKVAVEVLANQMAAAHRIAVVYVRAFNHLGPGQSSGFVVPSFAQQLLEIARGRAAPIVSVGDLSPVRDFSHVLDVVDAYLLLLDQGAPGQAYNVCSGDGRSIRTILDELQSLAGTKAEVRIDPERLRPVEIPWLVGNPTRLETLGWKRKRTPGLALKELVDSLEGGHPFVPSSASSSTR